jgi:hypothetical protein
MENYHQQRNLLEQQVYSSSLLFLDEEADSLHRNIESMSLSKSKYFASTPCMAAEDSESSNDAPPEPTHSPQRRQLETDCQTPVSRRNRAAATPSSSTSQVTPSRPLRRHPSLSFKYHKMADKFSLCNPFVDSLIEDEDVVSVQKENLDCKRNIAAQRVYANLLLELLGGELVDDWNAEWSDFSKNS